MPINEEYMGYETEEAEGYLQPHKYKMRYKCLRCGHEYSRIQASLNAPNVPCPKKACKEAIMEEEIQRRLANRTAILESQQAPGVIGDKPIVKAVDHTAQIVMEDHKMTDLKDSIRPGESMAPKLPHAQQQAADNFFNGKNIAGGNRRMNALAKRALAGAYKSSAVAPGDVFRESQGESPLRHYKTERG